jgi:hypothetical protein
MAAAVVRRYKTLKSSLRKLNLATAQALSSAAHMHTSA